MKHNIKLYKYTIKGIENELVMEAKSRKVADQMLMELNERTGNYLTIDLIEDVRVETLVVGESSKIKSGKKMIWVGLDQTNDGWMKLSEYAKIVFNNKKQQKNE